MGLLRNIVDKFKVKNERLPTSIATRTIDFPLNFTEYKVKKEESNQIALRGDSILSTHQMLDIIGSNERELTTLRERNQHLHRRLLEEQVLCQKEEERRRTVEEQARKLQEELLAVKMKYGEQVSSILKREEEISSLRQTLKETTQKLWRTEKELDILKTRIDEHFPEVIKLFLYRGERPNYSSQKIQTRVEQTLSEWKCLGSSCAVWLLTPYFTRMVMLASGEGAETIAGVPYYRTDKVIDHLMGFLNEIKESRYWSDALRWIKKAYPG